MARDSNQIYMRRAIELALTPVSAPHPNPRVGCVIVNGEKIIAEGFHQAAGLQHAELSALDGAGKLDGSTMFVTLEPCSTHGRTPPCAERIIARGISKVVIASADPNPVNGKLGIKQLRDAAVATHVGLLDDEARAINKGYFSRHERGKPWVVAKVAATLDGRVAAASGESRWISGEESRADVQKLRAQAAAVVSGVGTVCADNPRLDCRAEGAHAQPLRVIVDSKLSTPANSKLFDAGGELLFAVGHDVARDKRRLFEKRAQVLPFATADGKVDCTKLMKHLADRQINDILVEAGPMLVGALLKAGLIDELIVYVAPSILGNAAMGFAHLPQIQHLADRVSGRFDEVSAVGEDIRIRLSITGSSPAN